MPELRLTQLYRSILVWGVLLSTLIGCAPQAAAPAAPTPLPTAIPPTATATLNPTAPPPPAPVLASPTAPTTPVPPPATPTPPPAITATPSQPEGFIGPYIFPDNINRLTGEAAPAEVLAQRPLAIKISNFPPVVRPQWGLNSADLLFEHYAEGGVTRFTAVFYGQNAERVGSIRSGRLIDIEIPQMYDAAFAYSGSSGPVQQRFRDSSFFSRILSPDFGHGGFERLPDGDKAFEHTLFTNTYTLRFLLDQRDENISPNFETNMAFTAVPPSGGTAVDTIEVRYTSTNAYWFYQPGNGRYIRWTDGEPHIDAATEEQLNFKNVVVVYAHHQETDILEDLVNGGNYSIQIQVWGEGPVTLFRDGQAFNGRWQRAEPGHMLTFTDLEGNILPLAIGNTVFQIVPLDFEGVVVTP